jgi:hypothetical protein
MNFLSKLNEDKDKVPGILAGVAGTLPIALAVNYSWRKMQSNQPISASQILGNRSPLGDMGRDIGKGLHESYAKDNKAVDKITEKLLKSDELAKIMEKKDQRAAIVQSILTTIEDQSTGLNSETLAKTKEQLMKIVADDADSPEAREIVKAALTSIQESGSDLTQQRFANRFREFKKQGGGLVAPVAEFRSTQALNVIKHATMKDRSAVLKLVGGDAGRADFLQSQYTRIADRVGKKDLETALQIVEMDSGMGQRTLMARVYSGKKKQFAFQVNLLANATGVDAPTLYPMGENGATRYFGPVGVVDAGDVEKLNATRKNKWGLEHLRGRLKRVEAREMDIALSLLESDQFGVRMTQAARTAYNEQRAEILEPASRVLSPGMERRNRGKTAAAYREHQMRQARITQNKIVVSGLFGKDEAAKEALAKGAFSVDPSVLDKFEAGETRVSAPVDGRQYLNLQLQKDSAFTGFRAGASANRISLPVIARIEQAVGRNGMYISRESVPRKMGRLSRYDVGAGGAPIGWREQHQGGVNRFGLFDATGGRGRGFLAKSEGSGMAWAPGGLGTLMNDRTIPILDAKEHNMLTTDFMAHLEEEFKAGREMSTYDVMDNGKLRHATTGQEWDRWLGQGSSGNRAIHLDPQTKRFQIGIAEKNETGGKKQINLAIVSERNMESGKVFAPALKATHAVPEQGFEGRLARDYKLGTEFFARHGIKLTDTIAASGDQYKKAPLFLASQLTSALGALDNSVDPFDFVEDSVKGYKGDSPFGGKDVGKVADIVMGRLAKGHRAGRIHSQDVGAALGLLYQGSGLARLHDPKGENSADPLWQRGGKESYKLDPEALEKRMIHHFGEDAYRNELLPQMKTGLAIQPLTLFPGEAHGDWGLGRGSIEPRFLELTSGKLREAGMNNADVSEFMVRVLKRKIGGEEGLKLVAPLERMQASVLNRTMPGATGGPTFTLDQLIDEMTKLGQKTKGKGNFSDFLATQKDGITLDLSDTSNKAKAAISHAAGEQLEGQRSIYMAGGDAMEFMRGTEIKQAAGESIKIGSDYDRTVNHFIEDLLKMRTNDEEAARSASKSMLEYRKNITTLFSTALVGTARGKIKGASFSVAETLFDDLALTPEQFKLADQLDSGAKGQAVFRDTASFMSSLSDWMGNDKGKLARMYFTGAERAAATGKMSTGIWGLSTRNPQLFRRSTNITQAFRDPRQVARGEADVAFSRIKKYLPGALEELSRKTQTEIGGFKDIALLDDKAHGNAINRFFDTIADRQSDWWQSEGGGTDSYLRREHDVVITDSKGNSPKTIRKVDFGFQGAAYQDNDGDQPQNMILDEEDRVKLNKAFKDKERAAKYFATDSQGIAQQKIADHYLKIGMGGESVSLDSEAPPELRQMSEDFLKEKAQDRSTGKVNNAVDRLRRALLNNVAGNEDNINEAMAFINTLPEQTTIKSKQRTNYEALAEMLSRAIGATYDGDSDALPNLFKTTLYPQDKMPELYEGVKYSIQGRNLPNNVQGAVGEVNLTRVLDTIMHSVQNHIAIGGGEMDTLGGLTRGLMGSQAGVNFDRYLEGKSGVQAGIAAGGGRGAAQDAVIAAEGAFARVRAAAGKIDGRMAGIATLGLGAGAAILGMAGADGYDSEPLMAPGDMPSSYVQKEISSFNLLDNSSAREQGSPMSDPYDMMNTPINTGTAYMNRPNGYNIRGEIGSMGGVGQVGGYVNNLTRGFGRGSIMVNDTRRPITSSYVDRMAGEY